MAKRASVFIATLIWSLTTMSCGGGSSGGGTPPPNPTITSVAASPASASVQLGGTLQFSATVKGTGNFDPTVNWFVNDVMSGNNTVGTMDITGKYTAPDAMPDPPTVTVKDCSRQTGYENKCGTAAVTLTLPPPPPEKIVFMWLAPDGTNNLWSMNPDGTGLRELTNNAAGHGQNYEPSFSPDGTKIAFATSRDGDDAVYIMNIDGSNPTRLTTGSTYSTYPAWSPDGTKLAFVDWNQSTGVAGIALIELATEKVTMITQNSCPATGCALPDRPNWSPDGTKIVFDSPTAGKWDIYTMNADGTSAVNITNTADTNEVFPAWSPDGKKIAFSSNASGHWEIYTFLPDGSNLQRLTNTTNVPAGTYGPLDAAWSPDGKTIIFDNSLVDSPLTMPLYTVPGDGSEPEKPFPNSPQACRFPAWARIK